MRMNQMWTVPGHLRFSYRMCEINFYRGDNGSVIETPPGRHSGGGDVHRYEIRRGRTFIFFYRCI